MAIGRPRLHPTPKVGAPCPDCDGVGQRWEHWGWGTYDFDAVECGRCNGSGVVADSTPSLEPVRPLADETTEKE